MNFRLPSILGFGKAGPSPLTTQGRGFSLYNNILVNEDTSMKVSSFYRGVAYLSTQTAKIPCEIKDRDNNLIYDDIYYLLNVMPNPEMNAFSFRMNMIYQALIHGNFYAEIARTKTGRPGALWPLPNERVFPLRLADGSLRYKIMGGGMKGEDVYLEPEDVFHIKNLHTKDGMVGQGVAAYAQDVLRIAIGADQMAGGLFANGGIPSGIIEVKGRLSDESIKRMKDAWISAQSGRKAGGVAIFEEGSKFSPINIAPDILQFLDSRKFSVIEVARFLGLPPTKLFDMTASTYNNTENANLEVATDTLHAWARNIEAEIDVKLLTRQHSNRRSQFDLYEIFRGDMASRAEYFTKMMATGAITSNEIRRKEGAAPYKGGDVFYIGANNLTPVNRVDDIIDAKIKQAEKSAEPKSTSPDPGSEDAAQEKAELRKWLEDLTKK